MNNPRRAAGFTLIELLVVIVIIVILIGITIPVVNKVRRSAQAASTGAMSASLTGAIQQYHRQYQAYPGPVTNDHMGPGPATPHGIVNLGTQTITGSENLVLGLLGGLFYNTTTSTIDFDWELVGQGPRNLSPR